jgi:ATP-dependent Clp protease ATP-binding subunit ClpA
MFDRYSALARLAIFVARKEAGQTGATSIGTEHLLVGVLTVHPELPKQLSIEMDAATIRARSEQSQAFIPAILDSMGLPITPELGRVLEHAISFADAQQCREIRTEHLVASMLDEGGHGATLLTDFQLEKGAMTNLISTIDCSSAQLPTEESRRAMSSMLRETFFQSE